jgi:hypothetical protein
MQYSRDDVEGHFADLREALRQLELKYNPTKENLHFTPPFPADAALFAELVALADQGLARVRSLSWFFSKHALYADGMFWYRLFLLISAAGVQGRRDGLERTVSFETLRQLVEILVDISEFSLVHSGDIIKRNHETLGNIIYGFYSPRLV